MFNIKLEKTEGIFLPGEVVRGSIRPKGSETHPTQGIKVKLVWETRGKGTQDRKAVATQEFSVSEVVGGASFSLLVPDEGPCTFSGTLISVSWAVEVQVGKEKMAIASTPVLVSTTGKEIVLKKIDKPINTKFMVKQE